MRKKYMPWGFCPQGFGPWGFGPWGFCPWGFGPESDCNQGRAGYLIRLLTKFGSTKS